MTRYVGSVHARVCVCVFVRCMPVIEGTPNAWSQVLRISQLPIAPVAHKCVIALGTPLDGVCYCDLQCPMLFLALSLFLCSTT